MQKRSGRLVAVAVAFVLALSVVTLPASAEAAAGGSSDGSWVALFDGISSWLAEAVVGLQEAVVPSSKPTESTTREDEHHDSGPGMDPNS